MVNRFAFVFGMCAVACLAFGATADDFALKMEKLADDQILIVGSWKVDGIQGWSFGVCHNTAEASIGACAGGSYSSCTAAKNACPSIECAENLITALSQGQTAFNKINVSDGGIMNAVIIDFDQVIFLNKSERFEIMKVKYTLKAANAALAFCNTLGAPPVESVFVVGGDSIAPAVKTGVTLGGAVQTCELKMNLAAQGLDKVAVSLDTAKDQPATGFSFGIADDSAAIIVSQVAVGAAAKTLMGGGDPEFWSAKVVDGGATVGCVFSLGATVVALPACTASQEIAVVTYINTGGASATANVTLSGNLGTPKVPVVIDVDGVPFEPVVGTGVSVTVGAGSPPFVRGDVNQDGKLNVSDGVSIARYVFNLGSQKAKIDNCKDSADANDDGAITTADALYVLNYLFTGGPIVIAPFPTCGVDTSADTLTCVQYQCP